MNDRLQAIADELRAAPPEFQVEILLEHARRFPPLPPRFQALRDAGAGRVPECMAEVYFYPEVAGGVVRLHADVPDEAPTQRALVGLLMDAYDGATPADVAAIPDDLLHRMGLARLLGMQRQQGFAGILSLLKHRVATAGDGDAGEGDA